MKAHPQFLAKAIPSSQGAVIDEHVLGEVDLIMQELSNRVTDNFRLEEIVMSTGTSMAER